MSEYVPENEDAVRDEIRAEDDRRMDAPEVWAGQRCVECGEVIDGGRCSDWCVEMEGPGR